MMELAQVQKKARTLSVRYEAAVLAVANEKKILDLGKQEYQDILDAQVIAQEVARRTQAQAAQPIIDIVDRCLSTIFPDPYEFAVRFESRRGKTEVDLIFRRNGQEINPIGSADGGVLDVAAFAVRLAVLLMSRPPVQRVLILDEPFRFVSKGLYPRVRQLLEQLTAELKLQIIQVTHIPELMLGNVIELTKEQETDDE